MAAPPLADALRPLLTNPLDEAVGGARWVVGILGDHPSRYSRSPALWNAAFSALGLDARYAAFDVSPDRLDAFVSTMRASPGLLGVNVTVPYKQAVLPFLDGLDPIATAIGATNCVVRTEQGQLLGSNTDAEGALACLTRARPSAPPFFPNLEGATILLIGAGGAGRAVATALLPRLGQPGRLLLVNRTRATAEEVAHAVDPLSGQVSVLPEGQVADVAEGVDLVINASTRGQSGFFSRSDGLVTCLEPYSPLGPSSPAWVDPEVFEDESQQWRAWFIESLADLRENQYSAGVVLERLNPRASFFDLVYAPAETTMLRAARWSGHPTLNGSDMILHQAVAGFLLITKPVLGPDAAMRRGKIESAMRSI